MRLIASLWAFILFYFVKYVASSERLNDIQFGFMIADDEGKVGKRIMIVGTTPSDTTEDERLIINDNLNKFRRNYSLKILDAKLMKWGYNYLGNYQVGLEGQISEFVKDMRLCLLNSLGSPDIWKRALFYSKPLLLLSENDYNNCPPTAEFTLLRAVFIKTLLTLNENIVTIDYDTSVNEALDVDFLNLSYYDNHPEDQLSVLMYEDVDPSSIESNSKLETSEPELDTKSIDENNNSVEDNGLDVNVETRGYKRSNTPIPLVTVSKCDDGRIEQELPAIADDGESDSLIDLPESPIMADTDRDEDDVEERLPFQPVESQIKSEIGNDRTSSPIENEIVEPVQIDEKKSPLVVSSDSIDEIKTDSYNENQSLTKSDHESENLNGEYPITNPIEGRRQNSDDNGIETEECIFVLSCAIM